ncbi:alpha/beta fold hydrolase [Devosia albogilva]|uniref:Alpha/beta fold hydrolase n=1 Tax=Devosia albogilva TaxID=429726 RepID=A0ABW5QFD8_9HYPH
MSRRRMVQLLAAATMAVAAAFPATAQEVAMSEVPEPNESGYAAVNGVQVWYQTYGVGEPLVLLHGGLSWLEAFGPNIARLAEHRQVIGVDLQGHGGTGALGRPMTFEAMATDIAELIKASDTRR